MEDFIPMPPKDNFPSSKKNPISLRLKLCGENAGSAGLLDLLLGRGAEEFRLDDERQFRQMTLAEDLEESLLANVQDGGLSRHGSALVLGEERHQLIRIDDGAVELVSLQMVRSHTDFTEVTGMVLVKVNSVVMLTTGVTATTGMLAMFPDASMTVTHVSAQLSGLLGLLLRHFEFLESLRKKSESPFQNFKQIETTQL